MVAHYLEHFEPTSLSVSEEVNFSRESSFYQLGGQSRFSKYLLQRNAGSFAFKLLEAQVLSIWKGRWKQSEPCREEVMECTDVPEIVAPLEVTEEQREVISRLFSECHAGGHFNNHVHFHLFTCVYAQASYIL